MKLKRILPVVLLLLILPSLYMYLMYDIRLNDPVRERTARHCKHVAVAYDNYTQMFTNFTGIATENVEDLEATSRDVILALTGRHPTANPYGTGFMEDPHRGTNAPGYFGDAWEHQYLIRVDDNNDGKIMMGKKKVKAKIVVWSRGPNGENDWGRQDDIAYDL